MILDSLFQLESIIYFTRIAISHLFSLFDNETKLFESLFLKIAIFGDLLT